MVLRVKHTPTRLPTNNLYTPMDNTPLHSISSVCHPWGYNCRPARHQTSAHFALKLGLMVALELLKPRSSPVVVMLAFSYLWRLHLLPLGAITLVSTAR